MPSKRANKSSTRMHAAGAALSRNKLLKLVSQKGTTGEAVQFDHDYCSNNDSSSVVEFVVSIEFLLNYTFETSFNFVSYPPGLFISARKIGYGH